jgi:hypothetical protein
MMKKIAAVVVPPGLSMIDFTGAVKGVCLMQVLMDENRRQNLV